jgi:hypothetical protein
MQLTNVRLDQVSITTVMTRTGLVNLVQIGPGNTFSLNAAQLPSGVMNIIQNTLDNQAIRQTTGIQLNANSLSVLRSMNYSAALQRQLLGSVR